MNLKENVKASFRKAFKDKSEIITIEKDGISEDIALVRLEELDDLLNIFYKNDGEGEIMSIPTLSKYISDKEKVPIKKQARPYGLSGSASTFTTTNFASYDSELGNQLSQERQETINRLELARQEHLRDEFERAERGEIGNWTSDNYNVNDLPQQIVYGTGGTI